MQLEVERRGCVLVIRITGEMNGSHAQELLEAATREIDAGWAQIVLSLEKLTKIDSSTLGAFVRLLARARVKGGDIKLAALILGVQRLLTLTGLNSVFLIFLNEREAHARAVSDWSRRAS